MAAVHSRDGAHPWVMHLHGVAFSRWLRRSPVAPQRILKPRTPRANPEMKRPRQAGSGLSSGAPCRIRTYDALIRSQVLYPAEVRARLKTANGIVPICPIAVNDGNFVFIIPAHQAVAVTSKECGSILTIRQLVAE